MNGFDALANPWIKDLPVYEPGRPIEEVARDVGIANPEEIIKLASNENSLGPSRLAMAAMKKVLRTMHRYPDGDQYYFRQALAGKLDVLPAQILGTNGSNEAIELLCRVFLGPNTNIVMADRAFVIYKFIAMSCQAGVTMVPMRNFVHDLDAMLAAITPATRLVFIANPNNPTSTMVEKGDIEQFMSRVPSHVIVCFDEAYIELLKPDMQPDTLRYVREGRNVVLLRTFSKIYGLAGLRVGYALAPEPCIKLMNRIRQPFNLNAMAMAAVVAALNDDRHVTRTRKMVSLGVDWLQGEFDTMGLSYVPAAANFILVEVGNGRGVFEAMMKKGVIVRPMDPYGLPGYIRVTVGTTEENQRLVAVLAEVLQTMKV